MSAATALMNYDEEFARIAEETRYALAPAKGNYISLKGKLFTFPDGRTSPTCDAIVVDFIRINQLMPPYNPAARGNAKCWAMGREDHLLTPDPSIERPQADSCAACAQNKYGSATNGGKGKNCQNLYRLAVIPPDATKDSDIWLVKVSPTGLSRWTHYVKMCEAQHGSSGFMRVVTTLGFDPNKEFPTLTFKTAMPANNPEVVLGIRKRARDEIMASPSSE